MSVFDRDSLADSPLADLHAIAAELGIDGFRRLRRDDLIDAILERGGGDGESGSGGAAGTSRPGRRGGRSRTSTPADGEDAATDEDAEEAPAPRRRRSRAAADKDDEAAPSTRRGRSRAAADEDGDAAPSTRRRRSARDADEDKDAPSSGRGRRSAKDADADAEAPSSGRSRSRSRASRGADADEFAPAEDEAPSRRGRGREEAGEAEVAEGVVELLDNGSGFVRISPPDPSDGDVYISAAQVRRCELVSGDRVSGPVRPARRSERFPSLIRVDTINGRPADEVAEGTRFEDLPAVFPSERFALGVEDPSVKAMEWLTPFGRGSRVTIVGPGRAGKSEALKRLAGALAAIEELEVSVALAGVRPEELTEWAEGPIKPLVSLPVGVSPDAQAGALERAVEQGRRVAARGGHAALLIDTLDGLPPHAARRVIAAARRIRDGGSLTIIATAAEAVGGETTVIALDLELTSTGRFPSLDLLGSGTIRPELLVGDAGAEAIAKARAEASEE